MQNSESRFIQPSLSKIHRQVDSKSNRNYYPNHLSIIATMVNFHYYFQLNNLATCLRPWMDCRGGGFISSLKESPLSGIKMERQAINQLTEISLDFCLSHGFIKKRFGTSYAVNLAFAFPFSNNEGKELGGRRAQTDEWKHTKSGWTEIWPLLLLYLCNRKTSQLSAAYLPRGVIWRMTNWHISYRVCRLNHHSVKN